MSQEWSGPESWTVFNELIQLPKCICVDVANPTQCSIVVVVEFFNKTLSNAKQAMKMQADNTDTQMSVSVNKVQSCL